MDSRCYRFYPQKLRRNIESLRKEFGAGLGDFKLAYSFKTNSHPLVLAEIKKHNVSAEVVSTEEYNTAIACGFSGGGIQKILNDFTITGCTCLENDIMKKGFNGKLAAGDFIVFKNVGAYSLCFSNAFIRNPLPVEIGSRQNQQERLSRLC